MSTRQSGGLRSTPEQPASAGEVQMALFDINTRRRVVPSGDGFDAQQPFYVDSSDHESAIIITKPLMGESVGRFWLHLGTGRVTLIPGTVRQPIVLPGTRLLDVGREEVVVYDSRGAEIARHAIAVNTYFSRTGNQADEILLIERGPDRADSEIYLLNIKSGARRYLNQEQVIAEFKQENPLPYSLLPVAVPAATFPAMTMGWNLTPRDRVVRQIALPSSEIPKPHEIPRSCLIALGAQRAEFMTQTTVLITRDERLAIQRIEEASLGEYELFVRRQVQNEAMMSAKMAATAAHIYAADHDGQFPPSGDFVEALAPYTKDRTVLDGMTFTFNGENINEIQSPADTVIGWRDTAYGRAIAYADGSVRWRANP
ncbi:MAG: hypothetical protein KF812_02065 [Fimbriimonadaceae bacterium]|nr:hypothetical protein [Fimbriimonadaceae bacterium]